MTRTPLNRVCTRCATAYPKATIRCPSCGHKPVKKQTPAEQARQRIYKNPAWKRTRRAVLERDNHECVICGTDQDLVVDHIGGINYTDPFNPDHCRTLCRRHSGTADAPRATSHRLGGESVPRENHKHPATRLPFAEREMHRGYFA